MKELIEKFDLKLFCFKSGNEIYRTKINGLWVSGYNFYLDKEIDKNEIFLFFVKKDFRYYTTWPLELAMSHSKESFHQWFSFNVKRRYRQALRNKTQL